MFQRQCRQQPPLNSPHQNKVVSLAVRVRENQFYVDGIHLHCKMAEVKQQCVFEILGETSKGNQRDYKLPKNALTEEILS